jgi:hypothetical protein
MIMQIDKTGHHQRNEDVFHLLYVNVRLIMKTWNDMQIMGVNDSSCRLELFRTALSCPSPKSKS